MKKLVLVLAMAVVFGLAASSAFAFTPLETTTNLNVYNAINTLLNPVTPYEHNSEVDPLQAHPDQYWHDFSTADQKGGYIAIGVSAGNFNSLSVFRVGTPGSLIATGLTDIGHADLFFNDIAGVPNMFGTGAIDNPYKLTAESKLPGENFGWALESFAAVEDEDSPGVFTPGALASTWYSDPGLNDDKMDHMLSYHLTALHDKTVYLLTGAYDSQTCSDGVDYVIGNNHYCRISYTFNDPFLLAWEDLPWGDSDKDFNDMLYLVDRVQPIPEPLSMLLLGGGLLGLVGLRRKI